MPPSSSRSSVPSSPLAVGLSFFRNRFSSSFFLRASCFICSTFSYLTKERALRSVTVTMVQVRFVATKAAALTPTEVHLGTIFGALMERSIARTMSEERIAEYIR